MGIDHVGFCLVVAPDSWDSFLESPSTRTWTVTSPKLSANTSFRCTPLPRTNTRTPDRKIRYLRVVEAMCDDLNPAPPSSRQRSTIRRHRLTRYPAPQVRQLRLKDHPMVGRDPYSREAAEEDGGKD